jgi:hypothetical protein
MSVEYPNRGPTYLANLEWCPFNVGYDNYGTDNWWCINDGSEWTDSEGVSTDCQRRLDRIITDISLTLECQTKSTVQKWCTCLNWLKYGTVKLLSTHTSRWVAQATGYGGLWIIRGQFWCKFGFRRKPMGYGDMAYERYGLREVRL